jgi:hypothetical protein
MHINHHISFNKNEHLELYHYILRNNIKSESVEGWDYVVVDIYEDSCHWEKILFYLGGEPDVDICTTIFSKKELENAEWLSVRSKWHNGYPQPNSGTDTYDKVTYDTANYCKKCGSGLVQNNPFRISSMPNWGKRHFFMLNWVLEELFVSDAAKSILIQSGISGISFLEVKNKSGTKNIDGVYQLMVENEIPEGLIDGQMSVKEIVVCDECEKKKFIASGKGILKFKKEIFTGAGDIVRTTDRFGADNWNIPLIIISQRLYKVLVDNNLARSLCFEPIELV